MRKTLNCIKEVLFEIAKILNVDPQKLIANNEN